MSELQLSIVTPEGKSFEGPVETVIAPGVEGSFGVLQRHAAMISALETGIVKARETGSKTRFFVVTDGFVEVRDNAIAILANRAEAFDSAEEAEAHAAHLRG